MLVLGAEVIASVLFMSHARSPSVQNAFPLSISHKLNLGENSCDFSFTPK